LLALPLLGEMPPCTWCSGEHGESTPGTWEGGATGLSFDAGGTSLQEVVAMNSLSIPVTASSLSEPKYSIEEDVTEGVVVDDSAHIPGRCASTTTLSRVRV